MPVILNPQDYNTQATGNLYDVHYTYKYPRGMDLKPGSDTHKRLVDLILECAQASYNKMSKRYDSWEEIDQTLTAYIPLTEEEEDLQSEDPTKPVSIVVPLSFATMDTLLTYMVATFLDSPIFKYEGVGPEDTLGAALLERVIDRQAQRAKMAVQLHTMWRDAFAYGFGAVSPVWTRRWGYRAVRGEEGFLSMLGNFVSKGFTRRRERVVKYEGNELLNIDPYSYLPDTNVPIQDVQRGSFVGWYRRETRMEILERERDEQGYFNGQYLNHVAGRSFLDSDASGRDRYDVRDEATSPAMWRPVGVIYEYMEIIPSELGLGSSKYPEKWLFGLAGDSVIIKADPQGDNHNMFPVAVCAPDYDGYGITPVSRLEMVYGMQTLVNFLYNSHVQNVRKAVADMFVADPEMVNLNDLMSPAPGKIIRLRKRAWGRGVQHAVEQLAVSDITGRNIAESGVLAELMSQFTGAVDSVKGQLRKTGERVSATEFRGTHGSALSRLERAARLGGLQAHTDIGEMLAHNTQQYMTREQYVRLAGRMEEVLREEFGDSQERALVGPLDLLVDYDVVAHDGALPNSGDPQLWTALFQIVSQNEILAQQFDVVNIFKHLARIMGAKNISDFVQKRPVQAKTLPDEEVARAVERGDLAPVQEMAGA